MANDDEGRRERRREDEMRREMRDMAMGKQRDDLFAQIEAHEDLWREIEAAEREHRDIEAAERDHRELQEMPVNPDRELEHIRATNRIHDQHAEQERRINRLLKAVESQVEISREMGTELVALRRLTKGSGKRQWGLIAASILTIFVIVGLHFWG